MEQHLQLLASGQPILKPVYDHATGQLGRPGSCRAQPSSSSSRACSRCTASCRGPASTSPCSSTRRRRSGTRWKIAPRHRASAATPRSRCSPSSTGASPSRRRYIRPQRSYADIVVRFAPIEGPRRPARARRLRRAAAAPDDPAPRPVRACCAAGRRAMHLKLERDADGRPVERCTCTATCPREESLAAGEGDLVVAGRAATPRPRRPGPARRRRAQRAAGDHPAAAAVPPACRRCGRGEGPTSAAPRCARSSSTSTAPSPRPSATGTGGVQRGVRRPRRRPALGRRELRPAAGGDRRPAAVAWTCAEQGVSDRPARRGVGAPDEDRALRRHRLRAGDARAPPRRARPARRAARRTGCGRVATTGRREWVEPCSSACSATSGSPRSSPGTTWPSSSRTRRPTCWRCPGSD